MEYYDSIASATQYFEIQSGKTLSIVLENKIINSNLPSDIEAKFLTLVDIYESYPNNIDTVLSYSAENLCNAGNTAEYAKVDIFCDVPNSSYSYWFGSQKSSNSVMEPGTDVLIGDALGALHGSMWGPFGTIIEGALVSIAINEGWYEEF